MFFLIDDIINLIINKISWRLLETGRIKGDYNGQKGIITFEYRKDKNSFCLGCIGGNSGLKFIDILKNNINFLIFDLEKVIVI